jgi:hypothetical protein
MLEKINIISQIEITEQGNTQIRTSTRIIDNGEKISEIYHRNVIPNGTNLEIDTAKQLFIQAVLNYQATLTI